MDMVLTGLALAVAGIVIGIFSGMLGIGGGTVIVPLLRIVFGLPAVSATATSMFAIIPTSISGAVAHLRNGTCYIKLGLALGFGGAITSSLGVFLADKSPSWAIMLAAACVIAYSSSTMLRKALKMKKSSDKGKDADASKKAAVAPAASSDEFELTGKMLVRGFAIGLCAGLASGYVGVGGGFIMVPLMTNWMGVPMRKASGTSLIAIIILAIPGVIEYCMLGHVNYLAGIMLTVGSIPGAILGAKISKRIPERELRFIFAGFLGVAAIMLVLREFVF